MSSLFGQTGLNAANRRTERLYQLLFGLMTVLLIVPVLYAACALDLKIIQVNEGPKATS